MKTYLQIQFNFSQSCSMLLIIYSIVSVVFVMFLKCFNATDATVTATKMQCGECVVKAFCTCWATRF